jgi:ApaG protein
MKKLTSILVNVNPSYVLEQSDPSHHKFVWSYDILITNNSEEIVQLLHRFWRITDMTGKVEELHGAGVVGLQPLIKPGKQFTYTSYCQLMTPHGTMEGHYEFETLSEEHFSVSIPKFILSVPSSMTDRSRLH